MDSSEQSRFDELYLRHLRMLKLQGKSDSTIDVYARAVRRVTNHFDCCPDQLTPEQLEVYFGHLVDSHSWSTVKVDHNGLKYLSRYLYRGVITEKNILAGRDGQVTFSYIESKTGQKCYRTLKGEDFLWQILQHVLPRGFRRARDYGFLHGNAKRLLKLVQLVLRVMIKTNPLRPRPFFKCPHCKAAMEITAFRRPAWLSG